MILLAATAFAADLCATLSRNLQSAPASFATAQPLAGATCSVDGDGYRCVYPMSVENDGFFAAYHAMQEKVDACRLGAHHVEATTDEEILYRRASWTTAGAVVEVGVAGVGTGIEVYVGRMPRS